MNGKTYDVSDTVVCDFDYVGVNGGGFGKIRWWKEHLKSGKRRITILSDNNVRSIIKPDRIDSKIEIYYNYGSATYFMGDPRGSTSEKPQIEYIETYSKSPKATVVDATPLTAEQLQKNFGIKIISYSYSPPIENTIKLIMGHYSTITVERFKYCCTTGNDSSMNRLFTKAVFLWSNINIRI